MTDTMQSIISALDTSSFDSELLQAVLNRLESFGYELKESDAWMIGFCLSKVENQIKNECNISDIPDGLFHVVVDMTCGEFLFSKKQVGQLELGDLDLTGALSSIKEGDTQISFNTDESDSDKIDSLLNYLLNSGKGDLVCYRKIRW